MDINKFAHEVHKNAVDHGWWEGERAYEETLALIHSEWSEALEEYRNDRQMEYKVCLGCGEPCEMQACSCYHTGKDGGWCNEDDIDPKPEGIAVELIDGCIRILDYIAASDIQIIAPIEEIEKHALEVIQSTKYQWPMEFPIFIGLLHTTTSLAFIKDEPALLLQCIGNVFLYIREQGLDPERIMREKHEYNKTRPYLHGGKKC